MRRVFCVALCAALAASAVPARADVISGSIDWDAELSTSKVTSSSVLGPVFPPQPPAITFTDWSKWTFSDLTLPTNGKLTGDLNIVTLVKNEAAQWKDAPFTLTFVIHDGPGRGMLGADAVGAVTFTGELNGKLMEAANGQVTSTMNINWLGPTSKTLDINHHLYTLSISAFIGTGTLPNPSDLGDVRLDIEVRHNPEPAGAVLAALALPALAFAGLRKKRRWDRPAPA